MLLQESFLYVVNLRVNNISIKYVYQITIPDEDTQDYFDHNLAFTERQSATVVLMYSFPFNLIGINKAIYRKSGVN